MGVLKVTEMGQLMALLNKRQEMNTREQKSVF